jgi:hypothetical protein
MSDDLLSDIFSLVLGVRNPRTGKTIQFNLTRREYTYVYFKPKGSSYKFCYTPHADQDGWYYSFVYKPIGKGARTGEAKRWKLTKLVPHRVRKAAKARALRLFNSV